MKKVLKKAKAKAANTVPTKEREEEFKSIAHVGDRDEDGRTDYGGLPNRDLKKNLGGCG